MASIDYSNQLDALKKAQKNAAVADLQNTRNQALSNLTAEQQQNAANYATQRNTANAQNRLSARNFQEYLASTGRANSGLAAQAGLQSTNNLNTAMNNIYGAENAANADIARRRTDALNSYSSGLAAANANIEANYIQSLLDEKAKAWDRAMQEKQYQESIRQFNENLKLQKAQLNKSFSSGSGGGSYYYKNGSKNSGKNSGNNYELTDNQVENNQKVSVPTSKSSSSDIKATNTALAKVASNGDYYVKYVKTKQGGIAEQLWKKVAGKNNDVRVR